MNLEHIVKVIFYSPIKLSKAGENFIITLIRHKQREFNKLGVFSLYCLALALQERLISVNLAFFSDGNVLKILMKFTKDKRSQAKETTYTNQRLMARSAELETNEEGQELKKLRVVALQILVIVTEYANTLGSSERTPESDT